MARVARGGRTDTVAEREHFHDAGDVAGEGGADELVDVFVGVEQSDGVVVTQCPGDVEQASPGLDAPHTRPRPQPALQLTRVVRLHFAPHACPISTSQIPLR